jgi:DNA-binding MarR family transcriptional regulator
MATRPTKAALAGEVWRTLLAFLIASSDEHRRALDELGLTPGDMKAFLVLQPDEPKSMGELAGIWACDASNATWMVDRLEERGWVQRQAKPGDRRVKTVVLTPDGEKMKTLLVERISVPPEALLELDRASLEQLRDALGTLPESPPIGSAH